MTYRDHLARKGYHPVTIERTPKAAGHVVLRSWALPAQVIPAKAKDPA